MNLTGGRLLGVDRSGLASRRFGLLVSADSRPAFNAFLKKVFESQAKETCELALRKEGQEPLWARIDATATQDSQACRAAVVDITERKRAEAEVQAAQEKLSVEQRRGQRRLKKVIRELERRNRDLQDFVHAASHDLRAPLVNICGFGDLLGSACQRARTAVAGAQDGESLRAGLRPLLDEEIPESLGYIRTSSSKMDALLTGLLNVSRIGSAALTIEQLDLNEMVAGIVRSTEFSVEQAGATVEVDALPPCRGDANQLGQVFSNLLDNALKYLDPTRPGVIRVSGRRKQKEVVYCVEDNGIGIDAGHQDAIFGLFHRLNPDRGSGLGLGLTIARRSLDRQGGKNLVGIDAQPGQQVLFFAALCAVVRIRPLQTPSTIGNRGPTMKEDTVILMAEDDDGHATLTRMALREVGVNNEIIRLRDGTGNGRLPLRHRPGTFTRGGRPLSPPSGSAYAQGRRHCSPSTDQARRATAADAGRRTEHYRQSARNQNVQEPALQLLYRQVCRVRSIRRGPEAGKTFRKRSHF